MRRTWLLSTLAGCLVVPLTLSSAPAETSFEGQTINIIVGARGGSLTVGAELVGRHLGRFLPGNPTIVNQQMPGGAHQIAANHVFNVAERDGTTILAVNPNIAIAQLAGVETARFDMREFQWIGSTGSDGVMFSISAELPYETWEEFAATDQEYVCGTTGPGSNAHDMPLLLMEFADAPIRLVPGYPANSDILLALERGEVHCWSALGTTVHNGVERGSVRALVRGRFPVPGYEHLPVDEELATSEIGRALMAVRGVPLSLGRGFAVPPGTPDDVVETMRDAFAQMIEDPQFLEEAERAGFHITYVTPDELEEGFASVLDQPPEVLEAMETYIPMN
jgi:tripartite-type tricarboxylate transporter receptor subunit TctC